MSLFNRALRPPSTWSEEAIERYLSAIRADVEPDPLFRRRLRSEVVNRYVAVREGIINPTGERAAGRAMGRLGRATLSAGFALAATSASVLASSQDALPGDVLYGLKLRVEQIRVELLPAHLHDELVANMLSERIEEASRLASAGNLDSALALAPVIAREHARLEALAAHPETGAHSRVEHHLAAVTQLVERLPHSAQTAIEGAIADDPALAPATGPVPRVNNGGDNNTGVNPNGSTNNGGDSNTGSNAGARHGRGAAAPPPAESAEPTATPEPSESPEPSPTPKPSPTEKPAGSPKPSPSPEPDHSSTSGSAPEPSGKPRSHGDSD